MARERTLANEKRGWSEGGQCGGGGGRGAGRVEGGGGGGGARGGGEERIREGLLWIWERLSEESSWINGVVEWE